MLLLLPWHLFKIPFITVVVIVLVSLMVAMVTFLNWVEVRNIHCNTIILLSSALLIIFMDTWEVLLEYSLGKKDEAQ